MLFSLVTFVEIDLTFLQCKEFMQKVYPIGNLVPRISLLPVERPWLGLVTCLPKSGRLQTNVLGEGQISVRFVSATLYLTLS